MFINYSYNEFMPQKYISDSFDDLEIDRIKFEKKNGLILLFSIFQTFGIFGSAKYKNYNVRF